MLINGLEVSYSPGIPQCPSGAAKITFRVKCLNSTLILGIFEVIILARAMPGGFDKIYVKKSERRAKVKKKKVY